MSLYTELKDRKVIRVAAVYLVVAWVIVQVVVAVGGPLMLPDWFARAIILLLTAGFPFALIIAWAFDATPAEGGGSAKGKPLAIGLIAVTAVAAGFILMGFNSGEPEAEQIVASEALPVTPIAAPTSAPEPEEGVLPNSVAVLLCDNLSPNPDDAYFAAGIHEEILNQLVKLSALNVIARTSVMKYSETNMGIPEIAGELNVESVMECSVRFAGTSIMVTAQLIDPVTNSHLWSETYPGDISDLSGVFAMQADIATNIAHALNAEFSLEEQERVALEPTNSSEAYSLYLKAVSLYRGSGYVAPETVAYLDEALSLDPKFALALATKAWALTNQLRFGIDITQERESLAFDSAEQALSMNAELVEGHLALAALHTLNWRRLEAESAYQKANELYPGSTLVLNDYALFKRAIGDFEEAIRLLNLVLQTDPNDPIARHQLGVTYRQAGDLDAAQSAVEMALILNPYLIPSHFELGLLRGLKGEASEESAQYLRGVEADPSWESIGFLRAMIAVAYSKMGFAKDAANTLESLKEMNADGRAGDISLALAYLAVNEDDLAYELIKQTIDDNTPLELNTTVEMKFNGMKMETLEEPRFVELRNRMGFLD